MQINKKAMLLQNITEEEVVYVNAFRRPNQEGKIHVDWEYKKWNKAINTKIKPILAVASCHYNHNLIIGTHYVKRLEDGIHRIMVYPSGPITVE